jgi:hypothetical protein
MGEAGIDGRLNHLRGEDDLSHASLQDFREEDRANPRAYLGGRRYNHLGLIGPVPSVVRSKFPLAKSLSPSRSSTKSSSRTTRNEVVGPEHGTPEAMDAELIV